MNNSMIKKFCSFCCKKTDRKNYKFILAAYVILLCVIAAFHEPWGDESQSWQIARCASVYDILFTIPHYEGHPQLWHLILVPFAKMGLPYELSLKFVNILFSSLAVGVMLYKTKLPDMMKVFVPFTYFPFYQFGVVSRPYSILFLALMLCAASYEKRDEKPAPFVLSMILLCLSAAYGMAIACGMCIVWIIHFLQMGGIRKALSEMTKSGVLAGLAVMLVFAVTLLIFIFPAPDCFNNTCDSTTHDLLSSLIYAVWGLIYDATVGNMFGEDQSFSGITVISANLIYIIPLASLLIAALVYYGRKKKKLTELLVPYIFLDFSLVAVRMYGHHVGIVTLLLIYWLCICSDDADETAASPAVSDIVLWGAVCITILTQLIWSIMSAATDIGYNYSCGRELGKFINEENITSDDKCVCSYIYINTADGKQYAVLDDAIDIVECVPYLGNNIFLNYNYGRDDTAYNTHITKQPFSEEYYDEIEYIRSAGIPKYIFGVPIVCDRGASSDENNSQWDSSLNKDFEFDYYFKEHKYTICKTVSYKSPYKGRGVLHYYDVYKLADEQE